MTRRPSETARRPDGWGFAGESYPPSAAMLRWLGGRLGDGEPLSTLDPATVRAVDHYGMMRTELENLGTPIGANDLMIAATARAHDAVLVTHNVRELSRVANLRFGDWES